MIVNIVQIIVDGYVQASKENRRQQSFDELEYTPFLFSSSYLKELLNEAKTKDERMLIFDHIHRHDAYEEDNYNDLQNNIIDQYWRD